MTEPANRDEQSVALAFLQLYVADQEAGRLGRLEDYVGRFPGFEAVVAREYASRKNTFDESFWKAHE